MRAQVARVEPLDDGVVPIDLRTDLSDGGDCGRFIRIESRVPLILVARLIEGRVGLIGRIGLIGLIGLIRLIGLILLQPGLIVLKILVLPGSCLLRTLIVQVAGAELAFRLGAGFDLFADSPA